jgi:ribonuclease HII
MLQNKFTNYNLECGVDECGRGCLSGPVTAAAVILPEDFNHPKLNDSKKMSKKSIEEVYFYLTENKDVMWSVASISPQIIDNINILQATFRAMHQAISQLLITPEFLLIDGDKFRNYNGINHMCIIKGDSKSSSIAAASVIAKYTRDTYMKELAKDFPGYDWETNAGYGTKKHIEGIRSLGFNDHHRKTFNVKL